MAKIRIILETPNKNIGYLIDCDSHHVKSGTFNEDCDDIVEISQNGQIQDVTQLAQQIQWTILGALKK